MNTIKTLGIVGAGVIGSGWAARALAHGLDVIATDPSPNAETQMRANIANAWPSLEKLGVMPNSSQDRLTFTPSLEELCQKADFIQENAPERQDLKNKLHEQMDAFTAPNIIIASSSSGLLPSDIQVHTKNPERMLIGHPFNPVYLLPLVEIVGGKDTSQDNILKAKAFYKSLAMHPLVVRNEIEGYLADRLQEALWREILHLVNDNIANTGELDDAIIYGPGLRWAMMGTNLTYHLAGGDMGMRHMLEQFGPALKLPWTKLEAPELSDSLIDKMVEGTQQQAQNKSIKELERLRDNCLISIMRALQEHQYASGRIMTELDGKRYQASSQTIWQENDDINQPLELYTCKVSPTWIDYNGHMTEASYLTAFGEASDQLFRYIGIDENYRNEGKGHSFYTVESHINFYKEVGSGEPLRFTTQVIGLDEKRLHFFHNMYHADQGDLIATTEQMLLHVDMQASAAAPILPNVYKALRAIWVSHKTMTTPKQVGRQMKVRSS